MESVYEARVQDVASRDPGPLLWTVSLPFDRVLNAPSLAAGEQQAPNGLGGTTIHEVGERRREMRARVE